jgi:alpha-glucosidase (family GH31 glycosyl hydrolase)
MKTVTAAAPLGTIPLFVREGAIVPRGDIVKLNNNWETNWRPKLRIEVFPSPKEPSEFSYFTGNGVQKITASRQGNSLTIQFGDLGATGVLEIYSRKATVVTRNGAKLREGADYKYDAQAQRLTVSFNGPSEIVLKDADSLF